MQLNKLFAVLKLTNKVKELYTLENNNRISSASNALDQQITLCYRTVSEKNYSYAWCDSIDILVKKVSSLNRSVMSSVTKLKEYNEMKLMYEDVRRALVFTDRINDMMEKYEKLVIEYVHLSQNDLIDCYEKLKNNPNDVNHLELFEKDLLEANEKMSHTSWKYLEETIQNNHKTLTNLAKEIMTILSNKEKAFDAIDFSIRVEDTYHSSIEYVKRCLEEYQKSNNNFYDLIKKDIALDRIITVFCETTGDLIQVKKQINFNYVKPSSKEKFDELFKAHTILFSLLTKKEIVFNGMNLEKSILSYYHNYASKLKLYNELYSNSKIDFYKEIRKDKGELNHILNQFSELKKYSKSEFDYLSDEAKGKAKELFDLNTIISQYMDNKDVAYTGIDLSVEIEKICTEPLKQAKALHAEYDKNPESVCNHSVIKVGNVTPNELQKSIKKIANGINNQNKEFIDNISIFNDLVKEIDFLLEVEDVQSYYQLIQQYPFHSSLENAKRRYRDMDRALPKKNYKYITFPFTAKWNELRKMFDKYDRKENKKRKNKQAFRTFGQGIKRVAAAPFILIGKICTYIFRSLKNLHPVWVIFGSLLSIVLVILAFLNIYTFTTYSKAYLVIMTITVVVVSTFSIIGAFRNNSKETSHGFQFFINLIFPLLPFIMLFLNGFFKINIFMELFIATGLIVTSVCLIFTSSNREPAYYCYIIMHLAILLIALIAHLIMRNVCNNKVMYVFFYIILALMEVYLLFLLINQNDLGFATAKPTIIYFIGACVMILAFLFFGLAAITKAYLWGAIPGVIIALGLELWGYVEEIDT